MTRKSSLKRRPEDGRTAEDRPVKKVCINPSQAPRPSIHISPVDRFNPEPTTVQAFSNQEYSGYIRDAATNVHWPLPKVKVEFSRVRWRSTLRRERDEDGLPVSPARVATFEEMNVVEREEYEKREERVFEADSDRYDPDMMSPFYDGILKCYGKRQVP